MNLRALQGQIVIALKRLTVAGMWGNQPPPRSPRCGLGGEEAAAWSRIPPPSALRWRRWSEVFSSVVRVRLEAFLF